MLSGQHKQKADSTSQAGTAAAAAGQSRKVQEVPLTGAARTQHLLEQNKDLPEADKQQVALDAKGRGNAQFK